MTRDEFIKMLEKNLKPDAEMDFLIMDNNLVCPIFLTVRNVGMNADIDDSENKKCGGIVFKIKEFV